MLSKPKMLCGCLTLLALNGCKTVSTAPVAKGDYCAITSYITYETGKDSPETIFQIEMHNSQRACVCELDCPKP